LILLVIFALTAGTFVGTTLAAGPHDCDCDGECDSRAF
jgi:hypothetical protein